MTAAPVAAPPPPAPIGTQQTVSDSAVAHVNGFTAKDSGTATKTDTPIIETPRSLSVITKDEIEERQTQTVTQALQYTAGVSNSFQELSSLSREYPYIRGFLAYQFLDGLMLHASNWGVEPYGLERIEVLKGPASLIYGSGSPGGFINLISKRPLAEPYHEVFAQAGSYGEIAGGFDLSGPVDASNHFFYRLTAMGRLGNGQIHFTRSDRTYIAPSLTWEPDGSTRLTVLSSYQNDPHLLYAQTLPAAGTIYPSLYGRISRNTFLGDPEYQHSSKTTTMIGYELEHRFDDVLTFKQISRFTNYGIHGGDLQATGTLASPTTINRQVLLADYFINVFQTDNQFKLNYNTGPVHHTTLVGVDYSMTPNYQGQGVSAAPGINVYNPVYGTPLTVTPFITQKRFQNQTQLGTYLQDQMKFDRLSVTVGVRNDIDYLTSETFTLNKFNVYAAGTKTRQTFNAYSPQFSAIYNFDSGFAPYVSYSKSFFPVTGSDFKGNPFQPNLGTSLEGGLKYQPPGTNILLSSAYFDLSQTNVLTGDPAHPGFAAQTGAVSSKGFEFEAKASDFVPGTDLTLAYTQLNQKVTAATQMISVLGNAPVGVPNHEFSAWVDHRLQVGPLKGLSFGAGVRVVGETFGDAANDFKTPPYALIDATLRYDFAGWRSDLAGLDLSINAKNVFNKGYVSNCDNATSCYYGIGRVVLATLRKRW